MADSWWSSSPQETIPNNPPEEAGRNVDEWWSSPGVSPAPEQPLEQPDITEGYWTQPSNIVLHYNAQMASPDTDWTQYGWNPDFVSAAYDTLQDYNAGKTWESWSMLPADNAFYDLLLRTPAPPEPEQYIPAQWKSFLEGQMESFIGEPMAVSEPTGPPAPTVEDWNNLTGWQKAYTGILGGHIQNIIGNIPVAVAAGGMGALAGAALGPGGALAGAVLGAGSAIGLGWALGPLADERTYDKMVNAGIPEGVAEGIQGLATQGLLALNALAEGAERTIGTAWMLADAYMEQDEDISWLLDNFPETFQAGAITYESLGATRLGQFAGNLPAYIEYGVDMITQGETDVKFAQVGEVWKYVSDEQGTRIEAVPVDMVGIAALNAARREIIAGASPHEVQAKYRDYFGISGTNLDLLLQTALDPLNVVPALEVKAIGAFAGELPTKGAPITGKNALAVATEAAKHEGAIGVFKKYKTVLRMADVETLTPTQRRIAGIAADNTLVKFGAPKDSPIRRLFDWAPQAKVLAGQDLSWQALDGLWHKSGGDIEEWMGHLARVTGLDPENTAAIAEKITNSAEFYTVRQWLNGAMDADGVKLNDKWNLYRAGEIDRQILYLAGDETGKGWVGVLDTLKNGTDAERAGLMDLINQKLGDNPNFTPERIAQAAEYFRKNPWAANPEYFYAHARLKLIEHSTRYMNAAFGVGADPGWLRVANGMKSLMSAVLLNLNPMYAIRNAFTNMGTRFYDGLFGMQSPTKAIEGLHRYGIHPWLAESATGIGGIEPPRLKSGAVDLEGLLAKGDLGEFERQSIRQAEEIVRSATKGKGWTQSFEDKARAFSQKVPGVSRRAHANDMAEKARALYSGVSQARAALWRPGGMITPLDTALRRSLETLNPDFPRQLMQLVENAKNVQDIRNILKGDAPIDAGWYLDDAARSMGYEPQFIREAFEGSHVLDEINQRLREGQSVRDAFTGTERKVYDWMANKAKEELSYWADSVREVVRSEGFPAALKGFEEVQVRLEEYWTRHFDEMERAAEVARGLSGEELSAYWNEVTETSRQGWDFHNKWTQETYKGILDGLGIDNPTAVQFVDELRVLHDRWADYYRRRSKLYNDYFKQADKNGVEWMRGEGQARWGEIQQKLMDLYNENTEFELGQYEQIGQRFVDMWDRQYPGKATGAALWWETVRNISKERTTVMRSFREWISGRHPAQLEHRGVREFLYRLYDERGIGLPSEDVPSLQIAPDAELRHSAWPRFVQEKYVPIIKEYVQAGHDGAWRMFQDASNMPRAVDAGEVEAHNTLGLRGWFGESKVVDEAGNPLRVYHGTGADFEGIPTLERADPFAIYGKGIYFTDNPEVASSYAIGKSASTPEISQGQRVFPVYLRMENPMDVRVPENIERYAREFKTLLEQKRSALPDAKPEDFTFIIGEGPILDSSDPGKDPFLGAELGHIINNLEEIIGNPASHNERALRGAFEYSIEFSRLAKELGYDGVIYQGGVRLGGDLHNAYVAFSPDQIRSVFAQDIPAHGVHAMGTTEAAGAHFIPESIMFEDIWGNRMKPFMDRMMRDMINEPPVKGNRFDLAGLDEASQAKLKGWLKTLEKDIAQTNEAAYKFGRVKEEMAMLDYNNRYGFDAWAQGVMPYHFWPTRTMTNWGLRFMDRPGQLALFARVAEATNEENPFANLLPNRVRGRLRLPMAGPEWMGDSIYIDPWQVAFPFREFLRPYERIMQVDGIRNHEVYDYIREMQKRGEITQAQAEEALETQSGPIYENAMAIVRQGDGETWVDFMELIMSPALYLTVPYYWARGETEKIGVMPPSRLLQGLSGATGQDWIADIDPFSKFYESQNVSAFGEWGDYYMGRMAANMVADGELSLQQAQELMIAIDQGAADKQDPVYQTLQMRVRQEMAARTPLSVAGFPIGLNAIMTAKEAAKGRASAWDMVGALLYGWLPGGLLPQGELEYRGLREQYNEAWRQWNAGDKKAYGRFLDEHPEYAARLALYAEPEERLQKFLVNEIWDRYLELPSETRGQYRDAFGQEFSDFLGGDDEGLSPDTLATWARTMGGASAGMGEALDVELPPQDIAQQYDLARENRFPGVKSLESYYYTLSREDRRKFLQDNPALRSMWEWQDVFVNTYPELIPFVVDEKSEVWGASPEVRQAYYEYLSAKAQQFPLIGNTWAEYWSLPEGAQRKRYYREHPELGDYMDWQESYLNWRRELIPYVWTDEKIGDKVFGKQTQGREPAYQNIEVQMSPLLTKHIQGVMFGQELTPGDYAELRYLYDKNQITGYTFEEWLKVLQIST